MKTNAYAYTQVPVHTELHAQSTPMQRIALQCFNQTHTQVIKINCCTVPIIPLVKYQGRLDSKINLLFTAYYQYYNTGRSVCSSVDVISAQTEPCILLPETNQTINKGIFFFFLNERW